MSMGSQEAGDKSISSHRLHNITPDSLTPRSGSPTSETGYSPHSQPFAERPTSLTSAGAAVRQSASTLPSPPPFTPTSDAQLEQTSPVAFANYSAGSCGSKSPLTDTPGVTSAWAASSTKPKHQQAESFAFHPHGASAASSPDVDQFQATSNVSQHRWAQLLLPDVRGIFCPTDPLLSRVSAVKLLHEFARSVHAQVTPTPLAALLNRTTQSITTSADADAASECSETASRSSVTSRGSSRRVDGQSPGDLLRMAKVIFEKRAAIGERFIFDSREFLGCVSYTRQRTCGPAYNIVHPRRQH